MINRLFGIDGFIDYHQGWLRIGRHWFGTWHGRLVQVRVIQGGTQANTTQEDFWFRNDDGSILTATYMGSQNSNQTIDGDVVFRIRIIAQENNSKNDSWDFQIGAQKNGSGGYTLITPSRTDGIKYSNDNNGITDDTGIATSTFDLTWSGTPTSGRYDDYQDTAGCPTITLNGSYTEVEFCLVIDSANASDGDYWDLQLLDTGGGALDAYNQTPRVTANISPTMAAGQGTFSLAGQEVFLQVGQKLHVDLEEGDKSDFDSENNSSYMSASGTAAMVGSYGLLLDLTTAGGADPYGINAFVISTKQIRFRFYIDIASMTMTNGDLFYPLIINATYTAKSAAGRLSLGYDGSVYHVILEAVDDADTSRATSASDTNANLTGQHVIEGLINRESYDGAADGSQYLWIDETLITGTDTDIENFNNFNTIVGSWLGAYSLDAGTAGSLYLDDLIINDDGSLIGPAGGGTLVAAFGTFTLAGQATGLYKQWADLPMAAGTFSLAGQTTGLLASRLLAAGFGTFGLSGQVTDLLASHLLTMAFGTFTLAGQVVGLAKTVTMAADFGTFTLAGQTIGFLHDWALPAGSGTFTLSGQDVTLTKIGAYELVAAAGTFSLAGQATGLLASRLLAADYGTFTLAGQVVGFAKTFTLAMDFGTFGLSGQATGLLASRLLAAGSGTFVLSGQDVTLTKIGAYELIAAAGTFSLAGQAAGLLASRLLAAGSGTFTLAGQAAGLLASRTLTAGSGTFTLTGININIVLAAINLIIEQTSYIVQVMEQDANIVQVMEQDANIVQTVEQTAKLRGAFES